MASLGLGPARAPIGHRRWSSVPHQGVGWAGVRGVLPSGRGETGRERQAEDRASCSDWSRRPEREGFAHARVDSGSAPPCPLSLLAGMIVWPSPRTLTSQSELDSTPLTLAQEQHRAPRKPVPPLLVLLAVSSLVWSPRKSSASFVSLRTTSSPSKPAQLEPDSFVTDAPYLPSASPTSTTDDSRRTTRSHSPSP